MASKIAAFTIESHGLETPCRLLYRIEAEGEKEIVRFPEGLKGAAIFSDLFSEYKPALMRFGIEIPDDKSASSSLKAKKIVSLNDGSFGEAFYRYFFPKMRKAHPEHYVWEVLSGK